MRIKDSKKRDGFSSAWNNGNLYIKGFQEKNFLGNVSGFVDFWELKHSKKFL